jgi:hypothetical protein
MSTKLAAAKPVVFAALFLCSASSGCMGDMAINELSDTGASDDTGGSPLDSDGDTADWDQADPAWWSLAATVLVEDALPVQGDTSSLVSLIDESADTGSPICQASFVEPPITTLDSPDASIFHWWEISLSDPSSSDCSSHLLTRVPDSVELGVGALHPDIAALLEPAGYDEIASYLYGAYLRVPGTDTIWTYGVAATTAGFDAEQLPVDEGPLPNGTYSVVPIYLLPIQGG